MPPRKRATPAPRKSVSRRAKAVTPDDVEAQLTAIERGDGEGELDLGRGVSLHVSSLGKVYFPDAGVTKGALMRYYTRVSPVLLPHIAGRPLVLKRYPDGVGGPMFFQQDAGPHVPDVVRTKALPTEEKGDRQRIIGGELATLLYTVQLGAIEVHPWLSRVADIDGADRCLIDLDPGSGDAGADRALFRYRFPERHTRFHPPAHRFQSALRHPDQPHAMMDPARPQTPLRDFKPAPSSQQNVRRRYAHIFKHDLRMTVRRVIVPEYRKHALYRDTGCVERYQNHGLLLVPWRARVRLSHEDRNFAPRIAGAGGPPL